jgi:hypothetical protein
MLVRDCTFVAGLASFLFAQAAYAMEADVVQRLPWGNGPAEVGRARPSEANAEGPMSLAVDADGTAWILDQVNFRILVLPRFGATRGIRLPSSTFQDLALDGSGGVVVLDRLSARTVLALDSGGVVRAAFDIEGRGVPEPGAVTGLFRSGSEWWLEVEHLWTVRVADSAGVSDPARPALPGIPTSDRSASLRAGIHGNVVLLTIFPNDTRSRLLACVRFDAPVAQLDALDTDALGRVWLAAHLEDAPDGPAGGFRSEAEVVVLLDPEGIELSRTILPVTAGPDEQLRRARLGADGTMYVLALDDDGASLWRVAP